MTIEVIPTWFDGVLYRSRTEARWAVFLSALGIEFVYESEASRLSKGGIYLPGFWLPDSRSFIDVTGALPGDAELQMAEKLSAETKSHILIVSGPPSVRPGRIFPGMRWDDGEPDDPLFARIEDCRRCPGYVMAVYQDELGSEPCCIEPLGQHPKWDADRNPCSDKCDGAGPPEWAIQRALNERFGVSPEDTAV